VDAFVLANPKTDLYNPNIIRSSVGGIFTTKIATGSTEDIIRFLKARHIKIYSAILQEAIPFTQADYCGPTAIVLGTEADGLSESWRNVSEANIKIPMNGTIDSLNLSVSAGIIIYEAIRQRSL
jgi:TrmH family RNA methyltransferase